MPEVGPLFIPTTVLRSCDTFFSSHERSPVTKAVSQIVRIMHRGADVRCKRHWFESVLLPFSTAAWDA